MTVKPLEYKLSEKALNGVLETVEPGKGLYTEKWKKKQGR
jgi:hypothetical protein